jgi:hypothetical protein
MFLCENTLDLHYKNELSIAYFGPLNCFFTLEQPTLPPLHEIRGFSKANTSIKSYFLNYVQNVHAESIQNNQLEMSLLNKEV